MIGMWCRLCTLLLQLPEHPQLTAAGQTDSESSMDFNGFLIVVFGASL